MGKGDQRTRRGKITKGTFGVSRPKKKNTVAIVPDGKAKKKAARKKKE